MRRNVARTFLTRLALSFFDCTSEACAPFLLVVSILAAKRSRDPFPILSSRRRPKNGMRWQSRWYLFSLTVDGRLPAAAGYVGHQVSSTNDLNVGTSFVCATGFKRDPRSCRSYASAPRLVCTGETFLTRSTLPPACSNTMSTIQYCLSAPVFGSRRLTRRTLIGCSVSARRGLGLARPRLAPCRGGCGRRAQGGARRAVHFGRSGYRSFFGRRGATPPTRR